MISSDIESVTQEVPVYTFTRTGAAPLTTLYNELVDHLSIDTIILADGGTDSLMRGDEIGLGTPTEDMASICAVNEISKKKVDHNSLCQLAWLTIYLIRFLARFL
jgi:hypothetical protein